MKGVCRHRVRARLVKAEELDFHRLRRSPHSGKFLKSLSVFNFIEGLLRKAGMVEAGGQDFDRIECAGRQWRHAALQLAHPDFQT